MDSSLLVPAAIVGAYLLGSVPFAVICSRLFGLADPRSYGSGNPGATNVLRSGNKAAAVLTLLGDGAKGWLAVFLAQHYMLSNVAIGLIALAVFFGHLFPIFLKFKGGKGVATAAGVLLALDWLLGVGVLGLWLLTVLFSRYSSLGALIAAAGAPMLAAMMWGGSFLMLTVGVISMALISKHWQNLQRLLAGTEPKVGSKKKPK
ncbi:MAG: acyl phosphate:glycerol-3-phosphate acyltransferase [Pseudomonadota bacterium]|jgi:acyl phosphate:glycerol-3-phosphate acyltransferase|nr:acyl phosphate:glycerol-3-phosphate acyltransferase [Pseudomonadota bacterium]MDQ5881173.1 acyl phosphate:glycerol-3-phosphate acyltransferase [Pseudomonadota bacterium]MDQ5906808.1 acyl phosphate:glycerol-3-phosphate acyltransferase [Pseudomonadota bacterium]MDQ5914297.1 acyl phosphate:glycerol-3-phosphate acyltransferase [Pseudomonadota bacterium]MDQ5917163.1 acyl phosphate:glycerol-3-phosphate acyltransferase [Pseudomonadota bacterium]